MYVESEHAIVQHLRSSDAWEISRGELMALPYGDQKDTSHNRSGTVECTLKRDTDTYSIKRFLFLLRSVTSNNNETRNIRRKSSKLTAELSLLLVHVFSAVDAVLLSTYPTNLLTMEYKYTLWVMQK
jgi:hypothetical protein